ncbi:hypothetical protein [Leisingera aquimarina]|nr:hypothetical protein [Leisingera aquimarina]
MTDQYRNRWFLDPGPVSLWIDQFADELGAKSAVIGIAADH